MPIGELLDVLTPPPAPRPGDVAMAQAALGVGLPPDYTELVGRYSAGRIGGFLWVFQPDAPRPTIDIVVQSGEETDVLRELADGGEDVPYPLFPEPGGLLPAGASDNGDAIYWLTEGDPQDWTIVVHEARGPEWWAFDGDLTGFLAALLSGKVRCPIFPETFPPDRPTFEPVAA